MDVRQLAFLARQPSAALKTRASFLGLPKKGLAFVLANALFWQPLLAQADAIAVSAPGTTLGQSGNGVPIVNIAAPNAAGLSHNQFHDYNVGAQGLILNNATDRTQSTQLGGIILGNPNLNGRAASTILNEVNGGSPSQLRGFTEVAGQSAHVIVANPYGISCNGCGFINTPQVTLTTGKAVIENGQINHYQVDQGNVSIDGAGVNATNVGQFEIITRAAQINAQIQAQKLTVVAGRNDVDAGTLNATARATDGSNAPTLAIDSSALGGMYAGTIRLVASEAGVGVKLDGNMVAGGDIQIDASGHLNLGQAAAGGAVNVNAGSLDAQGAVYAGSHLALKTRGDLNSAKTLAARDSISLDSAGRLTNHGIIEAGVNADNTRNATGDVRLRGRSIDNTASTVIASRDLALDADTLVNSQGTLSSGAHLTAAIVGQLMNGAGLFSATGNLQLNAGDLDNGAGKIVSRQHLTVNAQRLTNTDGILSSEANLTLLGGHLDNSGGTVTSAGTLDVTGTADVLNRSGTFEAAQDLTLASTRLDNSQQGLIKSQGTVNLTTGVFDNIAGGRLTSLGKLGLTATQVNNGGRIASADALTASITGLNQQGGELFSNTQLNLDLHHGDLNNSGLINAPILALTNLGNVSNQGGEISSQNTFSLAATNLDNGNGKLISNQGLNLVVEQHLGNVNGHIGAQSVDAQAAQLDNTDGVISSHGELNLNASQSINNQRGSLMGDGAVLLTTASLDNRGGEVAGKADMTLNADAINNGQGKVVSTEALHIRGTSLDNRNGLTGAAKALKLDVGSVDNRAGELTGNLDVTVNGQRFDNSDGGTVFATGALTLTVGQLFNRNLGQFNGQRLLLSGATLDNSGGRVYSQQPLVLAYTGDVDNSQGLLSSEHRLDLHAATLNNTQGSVSSAEELSLVVDGQVNNTGGALVTDGALTLNSASFGNGQGTLSGKGAVALNTGALDNSNGHISSGGTLDLTAAQLSNGGSIGSAHAFTASVTGLDQQGGQLFSNDALTLDLHNGLLSNTDGLINAVGALQLNNLAAVNNQNGEISSGQAFAVAARSLDNSNGKVLSNQALTLRINGVLSNIKGLIGAAGLDVQAASIDNSGGTLTSSADLDLGTGALVSAQGLIKGAQRVTLNLNDGDLDNRTGAILAKGPLTLNHLRDLNNQGGELSSEQDLQLVARTLDNSSGKLISSQTLALNAASLINPLGLVSGWQGLSLTGGSLDNRNNGT